MRSCFALVVILSAGLAHASYDLLYMPDVAGNRVHRYDPVARAYLGNFSVATSRFVAAHASSPYVVSSSLSVVGVYNGSNGQFVNTANAVGIAASMTPSGSLLAFSSASAFREMTLPTVSNVVVNGLSGILDARGIVAVGSNRFVVGRVTGGDLVLNCYNSTGTSLLSSTLVAANAGIAAQVATTGIGVTTSSTGAVQLWFTWRRNTNVVALSRFNVTGTTTNLSDVLDLSDFSTVDVDTTQSVVGGHGNSVFVVGADATNVALTRIVQFGALGSSSTQIANYTTSAFAVPTATNWLGANVVAPEPGSWLAVAAGMALVLRRRR